MTEAKPVYYDPYIAEVVLDHVERLAQKLSVPAVPVRFEELTGTPGTLPRIMMTPLRSDPYERQYLGGGGIANFPFALTLRLVADSEQKSLDAPKLLLELAGLIERTPITAGGVPVYRQRRTSNPVRLGCTEHFEDWQVTLAVKYQRTF